MLRPEELPEAYLAALGEADLERMLSLFAPGGMVHSPLYGPRPAAEFYPATFSDTNASHLTLLGSAVGRSPSGTPLVTVWFHFDWRLAGGRQAPFDVVDVMQLNSACQITELHIVYDTVSVRPAFEQDTGRHSWRGEPRDTA